jgi:heptosyltransferase II
MKKVLVRVPQWLGDAVVSTLFLERLQHQLPNDEIHVLAPDYLKDIFVPHPAVRSVISLSYNTGGTVFEVGRRLKNQGFERIYILPRSFRTAFEAWLAGIPERIGFAGDVRRFLLTHVFDYDATLFYPQRYLKLIGEEKNSIDGRRPFFPKGPSATLPGINWAELPRPFLGVAPASVAPSRTWTEEGFSSVANEFLREKNGTVILLGSAREQSVTGRIKNRIQGSVVDTAGQLDWASLGWVMSQLNALVANDSGLMHVASAFSVPTVVLFGASDPTLAIPRVGSFYPIQHKEISCVPCLRNHCVRVGDFHNICLKTITTDEVMGMLRTKILL